MYWDNWSFLQLSSNIVYRKDLLVAALNLSIAFLLPASANVTTYVYVIQVGVLGVISSTTPFLCNYAA